jgi:hypothetical protein
VLVVAGLAILILEVEAGQRFSIMPLFLYPLVLIP